MTTSSSHRPETDGRRLRLGAHPAPLAPWQVALLAVLALVAVALLAIAAGGGAVTLEQTARSLAAHVGLPVVPPPPLTDSIVWELRVPRVLLAAVAGAGLAVSGCVLQAVTRNPLAEPYLLGISSGASTGAVLVLATGLGAGSVSLAGGALVGGLVAFGLVLLLMGPRDPSANRIVLTGVVVGQLFTALTSLVLLGWGDADAARGLTYWLVGSLAAARWDAVILCAVVTGVALVLFVALGPDLDGLAFGNESASSLGVDVGSVRLAVLLGAAATTAVLVASIGAIGFVGLIVPHATRYLVGHRHRALLPTSAVVGALFLVLADTAGRIALAPRQVPAGVVTALLGVPVFLVILRRKERT
ncbi:iron ABC transporter permease [Actinotalea sp. BY-33]|uniref:Iron ABC transporter permease n=1 Tax=Actinotalea soli TaxID=2819234 RepID=A0A939RX10_9CELL|nr:iron ABC transporter permease [Actinotalea soli]MBO1752711.1 iron ABC transporter permease [Actinotalea soli]